MKRAVALAVAALAIGLAVTSAQASGSSRIVFAADRAPTVTGEIWRLDPNGHRVDLSKSPYQDTYPAVSWNGKRVAFVSDRGGKTALYQVGTDGHGLVPLGLALPQLQAAECRPQLSWQPHGQVLAVVACGSNKGWLWLVRRGHRPSKLLSGKDGILGTSWSPDGRVVVASPFPGVFRALSPAGRLLWKADGFCCGSWSPQGLLAVPLGGSFGYRVYDENGRVRLRAGGRLSSNLAWSPSGRLAVLRRRRLEVRAANGTLAFSRSLAGQHGLAWADDRHLIVGGYGSCECETKVLDPGTGRIGPASSANWFAPLSRDRKLAIVTPRAKPGKPFVLGVAPAAGGAPTTYARVAGCYSDGVWVAAASSLQFVGAGRSLVYESDNTCDPPFANLYSVPLGGGAIERLTHVQAQETQPALSPDGREIAYVWAAATGLSCKGCSDGIRVVGANGRGGRTLTNPQDCTFDDSPTWSPDGKTILYAESTCSAAPELWTIPARGGTPHDLGIRGKQPAWGPTRIAYRGSRGLMTAKPDGSDRVLVGRQGSMPAWSRTGRLAYLVGDIYHRMLVVGSRRVRLPFARVTSLAWSPDGTRLVVTASRTKLGISDLYTVRADGTRPVRLTRNYGVSSDYSGPGA